MTDAPVQPPEPPSDFRAGTVALVGRPNAGKSTLLNAVLGQKLAITSSKPQTTRNRIVGIHTAADFQAVLVDTPGIHPARSRLNRAMVQIATTALLDVDVICLVVDGARAAEAVRGGGSPLSKGDEALAGYVEDARRQGTPMGGPGAIVIALNKIDVTDKPWLLPLIDTWSKRLPDAVIVPISARTSQGIAELLSEWKKVLPVGAAMYPPDQFTEHPERFLVAELIREKVVLLTEQELPYATAVEVESFDESEREADRPRVVIHARIFVARESQKGIVIGKGAHLLKKIGALARTDIEKLLDARVKLELHVVVKKEWIEDERVLRALGYEP